LPAHCGTAQGSGEAALRQFLFGTFAGFDNDGKDNELCKFGLPTAIQKTSGTKIAYNWTCGN